jgi:hypothetical protein
VLEVGEAEAEWARKEEEPRAATRQDRWEEVKREAFVHVAYQRNVDRLVADLARRDTVAAMRTYADEIAAHRPAERTAAPNAGHLLQSRRAPAHRAKTDSEPRAPNQNHPSRWQQPTGHDQVPDNRKNGLASDLKPHRYPEGLPGSGRPGLPIEGPGHIGVAGN